MPKGASELYPDTKRPYPGEDFAQYLYEHELCNFCGVDESGITVFYKKSLGLKKINQIRRDSPVSIRFVRLSTRSQC